MRNSGLDEAQAGIKLLGDISITSDTLMTEQRIFHPYGRNQRRTKEPLDEKPLDKKQSEKAGLKLSTKKMKIMAHGLITSQQIDGETMETVNDRLYFGGLQNYCGW